LNPAVLKKKHGAVSLILIQQDHIKKGKRNKETNKKN